MYKKGAAESAVMLTLASIIVLIVYFILGVVIFTVIFGITMPSGMPLGGSFPGVMAFVFGILFIIGLVWILLNYMMVYEPLRHGKPEAAETPALILGIVELIFAGLIPGILLILAYSRIGSAIVYKQMQEKDAGL